MGSSFKEVQRKLEMSLEDLLEEEKTHSSDRHRKRQAPTGAGHDSKRVDRSNSGPQKTSKSGHDTRPHVSTRDEGQGSHEQPVNGPQMNEADSSRSPAGTTGDPPACTSDETSGKQATGGNGQSGDQPSTQSDQAVDQKHHSTTTVQDKSEQQRSAGRVENATSVAGAPASPTGGGSPPSAPSGSPPSGQPSSQTCPPPTGAPSGSPSGAPDANSAVQPGPPPTGPPPPGYGSHPPPGSFYPGGRPPPWGYAHGLPPPGCRGQLFPPHEMCGRPYFDHGHAAFAPIHGPDSRGFYGPYRHAAPPRFGAAPAFGAPDRPRAPHRPPDPEYHAALHAPVPLFHGYQVRLSNVPSELNARDLAEAFGEVSSTRVESVDVLRDPSGRHTGIALVVFNSVTDAQNAVRRYHGGDLNGRRLEVTYEGEVNAATHR